MDSVFCVFTQDTGPLAGVISLQVAPFPMLTQP